jgi:hypothetical protein
MVHIFLTMAIAGHAAHAVDPSKSESKSCEPTIVDPYAIVLPDFDPKQRAAHEHIVQRLRTLKDKPVHEQRKLRADDAADFIRVTGVPPNAKFMTADELGTMRHYSYKASQIIASKSLKAGPRTYIHPQAHEIRWYEDLTGVLLTTIKCHPAKLMMGLNAHDVGFVDVRLPANMTIIKLDECNYLIPGNPQRPDWIVEAFQKFKASGTPNPMLADQFKQLELIGGDHAPMEVPVLLKYFRPERSLVDPH